MATYNLGRVLPRFRGQWDPTINYDKLDVVYFEGSSYMAISDNINKRPDENESDWILSAAKGEPGEPGKDGPTYKAGKGISIVNNVISATGGGDGEGGETYFSGFGIDIDLSTNQINAEVKATFDVSTQWKEIVMTGLSESDIEDWNERNVFYYRGKAYYSNGANHNYVLNGTKWDRQAWSGFTDIYGRDIYIDTKGVMRYYAGNIIMKYDDDNGWKQDTINISNCYGRYMVNGLDGYDYYFENGNKMYYHEPDGTSTWTRISSTVAFNIDAAYIWSDENTTYYSNGSNQYYFDYDRNRWIPMSWRGDKRDVSGFNVWRQGNNVFYSDGVNTYQLKYGDTWTRIASTIDIYGLSIITDGDNIFHFYDGDAKQLVLGYRHYETRHGDELATAKSLNEVKEYVLDNATKVEAGQGITIDDNPLTNAKVVSGDVKLVVDEIKHTYSPTGIPNLWRQQFTHTKVYYYKGHVYYDNFRLDEANKQWTEMSWEYVPDGNKCFVDVKGDLYCLNGVGEYKKYNETTDVWVDIELDCPISLYGNNMFVGKNGNSYSISTGGTYEADKNDITHWTKVNSNNLTDANNVWHDKDNTYYTSTLTQLRFNYDTLQWDDVHFTGLSIIVGNRVKFCAGKILYASITTTSILDGMNWVSLGDNFINPEGFTAPDGFNFYGFSQNEFLKLDISARCISRNSEVIAFKNDVDASITNLYNYVDNKLGVIETRLIEI